MVHGLDVVAGEQVAHVLARHRHDPDYGVDGGPGGEPDEPEPEEDVDLLPYSQDAEAALALDGVGEAVLGEDAVHGVVPLLEDHLRLAEYLLAVLLVNEAAEADVLKGAEASGWCCRRGRQT